MPQKAFLFFFFFLARLTSWQASFHGSPLQTYQVSHSFQLHHALPLSFFFFTPLCLDSLIFSTPLSNQLIFLSIHSFISSIILSVFVEHTFSDSMPDATDTKPFLTCLLAHQRFCCPSTLCAHFYHAYYALQ